MQRGRDRRGFRSRHDTPRAQPSRLRSKPAAGDGSAASDDDSGNEWEYKTDKSVRAPPCILYDTVIHCRVTLLLQVRVNRREASEQLLCPPRSRLCSHSTAAFTRVLNARPVIINTRLLFDLTVVMLWSQVRKLMSEQTLTSPSLGPRAFPMPYFSTAFAF